MTEITEENYLAHYGIIHRSGRYPWGSGGNAHGFLADLKKLREESGMSDPQIAKYIGMTSTELRARISIAQAEKKAADITMAEGLKEKGMSNAAIARQMGLAGESSVRALLAPGAKNKADKLESTANLLREHLKEKTFIDVGTGVSSQLGISNEHLNAAIAVLEINDEGVLQTFKSEQPGTGHMTNYRILCPPGTTQKEAFLRKDELRQIREVHSDDHGLHFDEWKEPIAIDPKRLKVRYAEEGGTKADGTIFIRPGAKDLSIGSGRYAQVRIKVGPDHYLKGMAVYKDDLPDGVDLMFNTNKSDTGNKLDALKKIDHNDPDLPFGSVVSQMLDKPGHADAKPISALNKVNDEADWAEWSKTISAQMLSKQNHKLIKEQLDMTYERRKSEYDEIMALTNPTVKRKLLEEFADSTDAAAVHLKAAQLERSSWHVILPVDSIKPTEIYAPGFNDGERVALIRYPHGGTFEIPELVVNNKNREAKKMIGPLSVDAVGIHHKVAEHLSGADFDGDTVLVIPNDRRINKVQRKPPLKALEGFDPKAAYPKYEGMQVMKNTQAEMGSISNLITDMTLRGATDDKIARAVKHSMVVIDAEKHELNYKQSEIDNGIKALKQEFQSKPDSRGLGASTLISRAGAEVRIDKRKPRLHAKGGPVDLKTGKLMYEPMNQTYVDKKGITRVRQESVPRLSIVDDAHTLSSGTPQEKMYADHSNNLKAMANQARLDAINTPRPKRSPSAARVYANEVASLDAKLKVYNDNKPRARQADIIANTIIREKFREHPNLSTSDKKKIKARALQTARARAGVKKIEIEIEPNEWEAIQQGAISNAKLTNLLRRADTDQIRKLATPRTHTLMTDIKTQRANAMLKAGATRSEVAQALGVSVSTLDRSLKE